MTTRATQLQWAPKGPLGWEVQMEGDPLGGDQCWEIAITKKS